MFANVKYGTFGLLILVNVVFNVSCKKNDQRPYSPEPSFQLLADSNNVGASALVVFPKPEDTTSIDANIHILIRLSKVNGSVQEANITLISPAGPVAGETIKTDSSVDFITEHSLIPLTRYYVDASIVTNINPESFESGVVTVLERKWTFVTGPPPVYKMTLRTDSASYFARDGNKLMQMGEYLYSYGGWYNSFASNNDIYRSKGDLSSWEKVGNAPWAPRHTFGIGKIDSTLYIFGGDLYIDTFDVWKSTDGIQFTKVANLDGIVGPRQLYGACVHNKELFVIGGQLALEVGHGLGDAWKSPDGYTWEQTAKNLSFAAQNLSGVVTSFNKRLWVIGGGYYEHPDLSLRWTSTVYSSADGVTWRREPDAPWAGRQYANVCVWDNKIWLIGGHRWDNFREIWYMTPKGEWVEFTPPATYEGRHAAGVDVYNDKLVIVCGNYHNDCWVIEKE